MDLNYYLARHQISLIRAAAATTSDVRAAHNGLARGYAQLIARERARFGLTPRRTAK